MAPSRPEKALVLINKSARSGRLAYDTATKLLAAAGMEMIEPKCRDSKELSPCIVDHRDQVDCVIVGGGDGTLNAVCRGMMDTGLPLGVLPLGTANDFARSVGIPTELEAAVRIITDGSTHRVDVGEVNGHPFFNVASVGLAADLAKGLTQEHKRRFGRLSYAMSAAKVLMEARPFHATILIGDEKTMVRTMQVAVGNGRFYGGGNVIASDARIDDGMLDLYSLEFSQVWRMALMVRSFKHGEHGEHVEVRTARADRFEVITRKPRSVNADGELVTKTPAVFTQQKAAVTVYVPESCALRTVRF